MAIYLHEKYAEEIPFHKAGLNVLWTDNMEPYRTRKVRILNGAHTMTVLAAYLCGLDTVGECMNDEDISEFMKKGIFEEIIPTFELPEEEKKMFAEAVLERFANPFIKHMLLSISLNSVSKFKVRVLPSLKGYIEKYKCIPERLAFSLAALIKFYESPTLENAKLQCSHFGREYEVSDNIDVLRYISEKVASLSQSEMIDSILSNEAFWGEDLTKIKNLSDTVKKYYEEINKNGVRAAIKAL